MALYTPQCIGPPECQKSVCVMVAGVFNVYLLNVLAIFEL